MWGRGELQRFYNITSRNARPCKDKYRRDQTQLKLVGAIPGTHFLQCHWSSGHSQRPGTDCSFHQDLNLWGQEMTLGRGCLLHKRKAQSSGPSTHIKPKQQGEPVEAGNSKQMPQTEHSGQTV